MNLTIDGVTMTFLQLKCLLTKLLQTKATKRELSKEDYNKLLLFDAYVRTLDYKNDDVVVIDDNGAELLLSKKEN